MEMIESLYERYRQHQLVSTDSRNLPLHCLFFALKGANFNGNQYAQEALERGAAYAVIDEEKYATDERMILVPDVLQALQQLANYHRRHLKIPFIGITGSNGKTTSKELIREVLAKKFRVLATQGNLNNHIGVPLTLLSVRDEHQIAIIEMGANHVGEISMLCEIAMPDHGLITNIGKAHIEGFGGYEGVIKAKRELYDYIIARSGRLFVNADDTLLQRLLGDYSRLTTYGEGKGDIRGRIIRTAPFIELEWTRSEREDMNSVRTNLFGKYNFYNVLAAICIGDHFKVPPQEIKDALASYLPSNNRSQLIKTAKNIIYMDAYNANPSSMGLAIDNFLEIEAPRKMVILGDMLELGQQGPSEHQQIVDRLKDQQLSKVVLVGPQFQAAKMAEGQLCFASNKELCAWLKEEHFEDFHILIKGSRGIQLEKALEWIA